MISNVFQAEVKQLQAKVVSQELENKKIMEKIGLLGEETQKKLMGSKKLNLDFEIKYYLQLLQQDANLSYLLQ